MGALSDEKISGRYSYEDQDFSAYRYAQKRRFRYIVKNYSRSIFGSFSYLNNWIYRVFISIFVGMIIGIVVYALEYFYPNPVTGYYFDNIFSVTFFFIFGVYSSASLRKWLYRHYFKSLFKVMKGLDFSVTLDRSSVNLDCESITASYRWSAGKVDVEVWKDHLIILHPITVLFIPARAFPMPLTEVASTINGWLPPRS